MTLFRGSKLAISLPAGELDRIAVPGSVFGLGELDTDRLSDDLRVDLGCTLKTFDLSPSDVSVVCRSEMFTHGDTLAWLHSRLPGVEDHISFCDGNAPKVIPGFNNHLFVFRPSSGVGRRHLSQTLARAPELFAGFESQINSTHSTRSRAVQREPETVIVQGRTRSYAEPTTVVPFYLDPGRLDRSLAWAEAAPRGLPDGCVCDQTVVVYLTEAALLQTAFVHRLARLVLQAFFDPRRRLLLLAPALEFMGTSAEARLSSILGALAPHLGDVPCAPSTTIGVVAGPLDALDARLLSGRTHLVLPVSGAFWRHDVSCFAAYGSVAVFPDDTDRDPARLDAFYEAALGMKPHLVDLESDTGLISATGWDR